MKFLVVLSTLSFLLQCQKIDSLITARPSFQRTRQPTQIPTVKPTTANPTYGPTPTLHPTCEPSFGPTFPTSNPTSVPSSQPNLIPTGFPTGQPSRRPTDQPSSQPTCSPSMPTSQPTGRPTKQPASCPSSKPSTQPTRLPTRQPTGQPSKRPSSQPSRQPTGQPTVQPSRQPSCQPSSQPTNPTGQPSSNPSSPTSQPTGQPSRQPSGQPSRQPTGQPSRQPSSQPSCQPSRQPTGQPSRQPSSQPTGQPSRQPTGQPSRQPSCQPSSNPTNPSAQPSSQPSTQPIRRPTSQPSRQPTGQPSRQPSRQPTRQPTCQPSSQPTNPTSQPTRQPTSQPSFQPSSHPSSPSGQPTRQPTGQPSRQPSSQPSSQPSRQPTGQPSQQPTQHPSSPTSQPTRQPTGQPSGQPSRQPSRQPTGQPSRQPSSQPTCHPSRPTLKPTNKPSVSPTLRPTQPTVSPTFSTMPTSAPVVYHTPRYESIDKNAFDTYTPLWTRYHESWTRIDPNEGFCEQRDTVPSYPVCIDGFLIPDAFSYKQSSNQVCPSVQCIKHVPGVKNCSHTPSDTLDYLPPLLNTTLDSPDICLPPAGGDPYIDSLYYTLDQGIPPLFMPVTPVRLQIHGVVTAQFNDKCVTVENAKIVAWQVNPIALTPYTRQSQKNHITSYKRNGEPIPLFNYSAQTSASTYTSLRDLSCSGMQHSTSNGSYLFNTLMPPSYGPPRHIMFTITAPGYQNLTTRMYFDRDHRLQQLTTLHGNENSRVDYDSTTSGFTSLTTGGANQTLLFDIESVFPGRIANDPRVARLSFETYFKNPTTKLVSGVFDAHFNFVLSPVRVPQSDASNRDSSSMPPIDINGLWSEPTGGLVRVATTGTSFLATQFPHSRSWGSILGSIAGDTIRGVDFHQIMSRSAGERESDKLFQGEAYTPPPSLWSTGSSTGVIVPDDAFATAAFTPTQPLAATIQWSGGGYDSLWSKYSGTQLAGYRYLKLVVTKETGGYDPAKLVLNEIEFFEGYLAQTQRPGEGFKMLTPRTPSPQMVTCSSFRDQPTHCYRAFDGDVSANSAWVTKTVGSFRYLLETPQWVTIDFGKDHTVQPTAMRIVCDAGNPSSPQGCPMTFSLMGSNDNLKFDLLYRKDYPKYDNEYADGGEMFYFIYEHSGGRMNGQRCGSCDNGPQFTCHVQAYDGTCNSKYCDLSGQCDAPPECPAGEYTDFIFTSYSTPAFQCKQCAPGRYGNESGLTSSYCSGRCSEGYFCRAGSTSPTSEECGDASVFCPEGSGAPVLAAAGRFTQHVNSSTVGVTTQTHERLCPRGHYCSKGVTTPCPVGTYGDRLGLQTAECSGECEAGTYCPLGSIKPTICEVGHYCADGKTRTICAAGTFGDSKGLRDRTCSGLCQPGYYCLAGSVSDISVACPAGRYGSVAGLTNSQCSGLCAVGHFCTAAAVSATMYQCGGNNFFCPPGSTGPTRVARGYYSIGGDRSTRTAQIIAESGYYSTYGVRKSCPAGTFGGAQGLDFDFFQNTSKPSLAPSIAPSQYPLRSPTFRPTNYAIPTPQPSSTKAPTFIPTTKTPTQPTSQPSRQPTRQPTGQPTRRPSRQPTSQPSGQPSRQPTGQPTRQPTGQPSRQPSSQPSRQPTSVPSHHIPTFKPQVTSTSYPTYANVNKQPTSTPSFAAFSKRPTMGPTTVEEGPLTTILCSGLCTRGYYCPLNSTSSTQIPCPAGRYGSSAGLQDASCTAVCPLGHYCPLASTGPILCPAGVYGNTTGLVDAQCSDVCWLGGCQANPCYAGYFCPSGSIAGNQYACGGVDKYCPKGSIAPTVVLPGYYTVGGSSDVTRVSQTICEVGNFCIGGVKSKCPPGVYGSTEGLHSANCTATCPAGHYCPQGSSNGTALRCPAGRYGATTGLYDSSCTGICTAGYHCNDASTSPTQLECAVFAQQSLPQTIFPVAPDGSYSAYLVDSNLTTTTTSQGLVITALANANNVYCPAGTALPLIALPGYYTVGNNHTTRNAQLPCPIGTYCVNGVMIDCPAGRYGRAERLITSDCTGLCAMGHYCPPSSTSRTQYPCPVGRYGSEEGLTGPMCSGACGHRLDCSEGSIRSRPLISTDE